MAKIGDKIMASDMSMEDVIRAEEIIEYIKDKIRSPFYSDINNLVKDKFGKNNKNFNKIFDYVCEKIGDAGIRIWSSDNSIEAMYVKDIESMVKDWNKMGFNVTEDMLIDAWGHIEQEIDSYNWDIMDVQVNGSSDEIYDMSIAVKNKKTRNEGSVLVYIYPSLAGEWISYEIIDSSYQLLEGE